jgi:hypothetical protein
MTKSRIGRHGGSSGSSTTAPITVARRASTTSKAAGRSPILVYTPVHVSWRNQSEIYHSIIQRKVPEPNDFADTGTVAHALNEFEHR